jgi:hypothetical protein
MINNVVDNTDDYVCHHITSQYVGRFNLSPDNHELIIMDRRDLRKIKIIPLSDNIESDNYFYELTVFTGDFKESGTCSLVRLFFRCYFQKFHNLI